ncbi:carboxypeptidase-like regulatory domain-containing protein [Agarivorans sp. TSD2052]|uniref:carboxypeptidase-like regulatory domain-containing protein n=1 Tax=Agarivorans sp. TSD2052 TaxID=2937286 RepID=UPI00200C17D4|nr:carboxypeptidase-like regulatory domain-containing protein [Agarivorans sp. TSD2052]UPW19547.1 carboxypeptidase-like regulatory domain-containing protein [Agarivorans sp. TSD2052]
MMFSNVRTLTLTALTGLLFACGGGGDDGDGGTPSVDPEMYELEVTVNDANAQTALAGATVTIASESKTTNGQGVASFELVDGSYLVSATISGYDSAQQTQVIAGEAASLTLSLEEDIVAPPPEEMFIYHSDNDDSFYVQYWGDTWGSGAGLDDSIVDANFSKVIEVTSGTNWGKGAGIAWGNEQENAIDASTYNYARFNLKPNGFANVEVHVQGFNIPDFSIAIPVASGTPLSDGWMQYEVAIPSTSQLSWFAFVFASDTDASVQISNVSLITKDVDRSQPSTAAPTPSVSNEQAFSIFSDSLDEDKFVSLWNENWWNAPFYSPGSIDGDNYARYEIVGAGAEGGVVGIQFGIEYGSVDVSNHNTWNIDLYVEPGISRIQLQLVSTDGSASYIIDNPPTAQWVSYAIPFLSMGLNGESALNGAQMQMAGIQLWGEAGKAIFVDNFYFSGEADKYDLNVLVQNQQGAPLADAVVYVGAESEFNLPYEVSTNASGIATLSLAEGKQKVKASADGYGIGQAVSDIANGANSLTISLVPTNAGPTEAAPVPTVSNDDVIAIFSDTLSSEHYVTYWSDPWWNPPTQSFVSLGGNNTSKFQITPEGTNGGVTGIQYGVTNPVDGSNMTGLRFDFYATSGISRAQFQVLSSTGPAILDIAGIETGRWISVEIPFDSATGSFNRSELTQMGLQLWGSTSDSAYVDNIYFY